MAIPLVGKEALIGALGRFDRELRNSPEWAEWEQNRAHKYAIQRSNKIYPVKQIIRMATGFSDWLLHTMRAAAPKRSPWARAEFATLRLRLIKIAARVVEGAARIRVWLPTACPDADIFRLLAGRFAAAGP